MNNKLTVEVPPQISIVMAAYNEERDIGRAIESILAQTFVEWELIIIDDGSTDNTTDVVRRYGDIDHRIGLVCNETNLGLAASLNKGVSLARADLIARADADDVNLPDRLLKQYEFLQTNREIDVLGTGAYLLDKNGKRANSYSLPLTHDELIGLPFAKNCFFHPSVLIRVRFFEMAGPYDPLYPNAEDKEIWLRGAAAGCRYANLPEPLIEYNTRGYVRSWRSVVEKARSLFRIARDLNVKAGYRQSIVLITYITAVKLKVQRPRSLRPRSTSRP